MTSTKIWLSVPLLREREENIVVSESTNGQKLTTGTSSSNMAVNESTVDVKTLERCFIERIDREMNNIVNSVEDRITECNFERY